MPAPRQRRANEQSKMLRRPLARYPGVDFLLVLQDPPGTAINATFHQGRRLDAAQAVALQSAHRWEPSRGG